MLLIDGNNRVHVGAAINQKLARGGPLIFREFN